MKTRSYVRAGGLMAVLAFAAFVGRSTDRAHAQATKENDADRKAIVEASRAFSQAFAKGDAKEVASHWTENGEYSDDRGADLRGRTAIERAFAAHFKTKAKSQVEVLIESIRFPSKDTAIEEGILRSGGDGPELPTSSFYRVLHVREDGNWRIALSREWGTGLDRLEDLAWLVGDWKAASKDRDMTLSFEWDKSKPFMAGKFTTSTKGKIVASGTIKIGFDAAKGKLRSWHFDVDGGHGQAMWIRDGNRWVLDSMGALKDGTPTGSLNTITRLNANEINWRSIDRVIGDQAVPDTLPIKLTRVGGSK